MVTDILPGVIRVLESRFGLGLTGETRLVDNYYEFRLSPHFQDSSEGFHISVIIGWKKLTCQFVPGDKAGLLLNEMGASITDNRLVFSAVAEEIINERGSIDFFINNSRQDPLDYQSWPADWRSISLAVTGPYVETDSDLSEYEHIDNHVIEWAGLFFALIFPLLPVVPVQGDSDDQEKGELEGFRTSSISTKYERSRKNRIACLAVKGFRCWVCGINFEDVYGSIGSGFMEVHHIVPLSSLREEQRINPVKGLVPLCPNCHAMVHRRVPPYSVEELKGMLSD